MYLSIIVFTGIGLIAALGLGIAGRIFYVEENPHINGVLNLLPGANCGGCGFAGCSACAESIVKREAQPNACVVGGVDTGKQIAEYLGMPVTDSAPQVACPDCHGGTRSLKKYNYLGFDDCNAAVNFYHGPILCEHGCIGLGSCVKACKFDAITMGDDGLPIFNPERCVGCNACVRACPKGIISLISETSKILHWNQYTECLAPCRQKCPAQIDIPKYIGYIKEGKYAEAVLTIKEHNPFPLVCGRVCPELCALACRRQIEDEPVAINFLKRFAADWEMNSGKHLPIPLAAPTGKKVAVIGGGPSGLTCAYYLRRLGHEVEVFEKMLKLGGMLHYGIPEYRLPKKVLDWEIEGFLQLGVKAKTNIEFGKDFDIEFLQEQGFDAIFLALGAWAEHQLKIEGSGAENIYGGIDFLQKFHSGEKINIGSHVMVIGGGNTAIDAARCSLRLGAKLVTIVYRRSRDEMPANPAEIIAAEEEGIKLQLLSAPHRVVAENGKVSGLEILKMKLGEPDSSGRCRPVTIDGSEEVIPCDMIIQAIGQFPGLDFFEKDDNLKSVNLTKWKTIEAKEDTLQTDIPHLFTGGDCFSGPGLVVEAIAAGRFAARSIHYYITDGIIPPIEEQAKGVISNSLQKSIIGIEQKPRVSEPIVTLEDRLGTFKEVEGTIDEEDAHYEATRCLNCGIYCYNEDEEYPTKKEIKIYND